MSPTQITGLRPPPYFPTALTTPIALGAGSCLLGILYSTISGSGVNPVGVACILDREGHLTEIGGSDPTRKDAGVTVWREERNTLMLISEAATPGGAGSTSSLYLYSFPDTLPPPLPVVDNDARRQAMAATNIAKAALVKAEGGADEVARETIKSLATAIGAAVGEFD